MQTENIGSIVTSGGSIITGIATFFKMLPVVLGCLASLAGITLSIVLIYCKLKESRLDRKLKEMQIEDFQKEHNQEKE